MLIIYILSVILNLQQKEVVILNKKNNEAVSYATIKFEGNKGGIYANEYGLFDLDQVKSDSIEISCIGYSPLKLKINEIKDTIFLEPNLEVLDEVVINTGKYDTKKIGLSEKKKTLSWHIRPKTELATLIKLKKNFKKSIIAQIHIPIGKKKVSFLDKKITETFPDFNTAIKVYLYSNINNKPSELLLDEPIIVECNQDSNDIIIINLKDKNILYPKNGIFIGIEMIGALNEQKKIVDSGGSILPSFLFTKKTKNYIISNSFIKAVFLKEKWTNIQNHEEFNHISKYNMAIGLTLDIYKE